MAETTPEINPVPARYSVALELDVLVDGQPQRVAVLVETLSKAPGAPSIDVRAQAAVDYWATATVVGAYADGEWSATSTVTPSNPA